ncbi:hypothetical protein BC828DRAFT_416033 [Blastocladiella britannica]|nr:hypothetical protein BC828DRAFT_416033 [Blastocladiella britannica]
MSRRRGPPPGVNPAFFTSAGDSFVDAPPPTSNTRRGLTFGDHSGQDDDAPTTASGPITPMALERVLRTARADGKLNLSMKGLKGTDLPDRVYTMYDPDAESLVKLDRSRAAAGSAWWEAVDLTRLAAADNKLSGIGPRIATTFPGLESIDLHANIIAAVPDLSPLGPSLTTLNLASNVLHGTLPPWLPAGLPNLAALTIAGNKYEGAFTCAAPLARLTSLDLSGNLFVSLPDNLAAVFPALVTLVVGSNRLMVLPTVLPLSLRELDASCNRILGWSPTNRLPALDRLDLRQNRLTQFTLSAELLPRVKEVYLSNNRITALTVDTGGGGSFEELAMLDLKENQLPAVPPAVYLDQGVAMPALKRLDLTNNAISLLPPDIGLLSLHSLVVEGNLVRGMPRGGGTQALLKWLKDRYVHPPSPDRSTAGRIGASVAATARGGVQPQPTMAPSPRQAPAPVAAVAASTNVSSTRAPVAPAPAPAPALAEWITLPSGRRIRRPAAATAAAATSSGAGARMPSPSPFAVADDHRDGFSRSAAPHGRTRSPPPRDTFHMVGSSAPPPSQAGGSASGSRTSRAAATSGSVVAEQTHATGITAGNGEVLLAIDSNMSSLDLTDALVSASATAAVASGVALPRAWMLASNPRLTRFPAALADFGGLSELSLAGCGLTTLPSALPLPMSLGTLDLSRNALTQLPDRLTVAAGGAGSGVPKLHTLNLAGNRIGGTVLASAFSGLPLLMVLLLGRNQISAFDVDAEWSVNAVADALPELRTLDLSNNALARLDPRIALIPGLASGRGVLSVEGNCFRVPRHDVVARGSAVVLDWCKGRLPHNV